MRERRRVGLVTVGCLVAAAVVVIGSFLFARGQDADTDFGGTDAQVSEQIEASGYSPWLSPVLQPGSSEVESGLFALQAALGAGVLGFVFGTLRERRRAGTRQESRTE